MLNIKNFDFRPLLQFLVASLVACILIRIKFFSDMHALDLEPPSVALTFLTFGFVRDFIACTTITAFMFVLYFSFWQLFRKYASPIFSTLLFILFSALLIIYFTNIKIFCLLFIGINYTFIKSYLAEGTSSTSYLSFMSVGDNVLFLILIIFYISLRWFSTQRMKQSVIAFFMLTLTLALLSNIFIHGQYENSRQFVLYENPLIQTYHSLISSLNQYNLAATAVTPDQKDKIIFVDPGFVGTNKTASDFAKKSLAPQKKWNIVVFVLESVGTDYLFKKINNKDTTPFLQWLAPQSLYLNNIFSSGNISAFGQFSILTGLYPNPSPKHFEFQPNLFIPSIADWLGPHYDSFFVSASNNLYFAIGLNKTFKEYDNAESIDPHHEQLISNMFLDERKAHQFFLSRLSKAKPPFLAVYWSGATHYPYPDYKDKSNTKIEGLKGLSRYLENLTLLDQEMKQTYQMLENKKLLDNTIFIIIGDHGEAFGTHKDIWIHGQSLYQEEVKIPALIYQPKLFKPRIVSDVTSSVDVLPTLLDVMNISYKDRVQGESIFAPRARKYIFMYSSQDEIASVDTNNMKMMISFANDTCTSYDLKRDPQERHPLPCTNEKQKTAILKFRNYQPAMLLHYNSKSLASREAHENNVMLG